MNTNQRDTADLPVRCKLTLVYVISLVIAVLMAGVSLAGLLFQTSIYPTEELVQGFVPNDVVNLIIGLPVLLGSMWLARRGKLLGLLFWPGALFYVFYTYTIYVFSMPLNVAFLLHLTLVTLSAYTMIGLIACIDGKVVQDRLTGAVPERFGGGVLAVLGILFLLRVVIVLVDALINLTPVTTVELALHVTDFIMSPVWIIGGVLLRRREALGYVTGLGLLFSASMLFIGLIFALCLQPLLTSGEFVLVDVLVVFVMGLVCFIPFALFVRGVASTRNSASSELSYKGYGP
ncbi:MAG: hypothetical protein GTO18_09365 [Anaerolineales bacterium]|nr:hypothetical protein [Anaerolineales bacterium]